MGLSPRELFFGCKVHAARHTITHNHSVTHDVLVVGTTEVPGLGTP